MGDAQVPIEGYGKKNLFRNRGLAEKQFPVGLFHTRPGINGIAGIHYDLRRANCFLKPFIG